MISEYKKFKNGDLFLYNSIDVDSSDYPSNHIPEIGRLYTKKEVLSFIKDVPEDIDLDDDDETEDYFDDIDFSSYYKFKKWGIDHNDWIELSYETPLGETVVAFGYNGVFEF